MATYGVCRNKSCELSYEGRASQSLREMLIVLENREGRGNESKDNLDVRIRTNAMNVFQQRQFCSQCQQGLIFNTLPTRDIDPSSAAYDEATGINTLLDRLPQLQSRGIIPW